VNHYSSAIDIVALEMNQFRPADAGRRDNHQHRLNDDKLAGQIAKRVEGKRLLKLILAFLNAGVMENGLVRSGAGRRHGCLYVAGASARRAQQSN